MGFLKLETDVPEKGIINKNVTINAMYNRFQ